MLIFFLIPALLRFESVRHAIVNFFEPESRGESIDALKDETLEFGERYLESGLMQNPSESPDLKIVLEPGAFARHVQGVKREMDVGFQSLVSNRVAPPRGTDGETKGTTIQSTPAQIVSSEPADLSTKGADVSSASNSVNFSQPGSDELQAPADEPPSSQEIPDVPPPSGPFPEPPPSTIGAYLLTVPSGSVERHLEPGVVQLEHVQGNVTLIAHVVPQSGLFGAATEELSTVRQALTHGQPMHPIDQPERLDYPHLAGSTVAQWYEQEQEAGLAHGLFLLHVGGDGNGIVFDVFTPGSAQEADDWELLSDYANELMNHLKAK